MDMAHREDYKCTAVPEKQNANYVICTTVMYLALPVPILCFNCISIVRTLLTSIKRSRQMTGDTSRQTNAEKARLRLTYMLITLVVIYVVMVTPSQVVTILNRLWLVDIDGASLNIYVGFLDMLRGLNSCTNIIVYSVISRQFRAAFKEILCRCCRKRAANSGPGNGRNLGLGPAGRAANPA